MTRDRIPGAPEQDEALPFAAFWHGGMPPAIQAFGHSLMATAIQLGLGPKFLMIEHPELDVMYVYTQVPTDDDGASPLAVVENTLVVPGARPITGG